MIKMVHVLIMVYGKPDRNDREIWKLEEWLKQNNLGMVRRLDFIDVVMKKEGLSKLGDFLLPAHPSIARRMKNRFVQLFLHRLGYTPVSDGRHKNFKSPNFNIIGTKEDRIREDGREVL